jgi:hypothetical protein
MTYYEVGKPTTAYYTSSVIGIRMWKTLADQGAKTWAQLKDLGLTTWKKLGDAKGAITFYYAVPEPSTTYYEVTVS